MANSKPRLEIKFGKTEPAYHSARELEGTVTVDCHGGHILHVTRFFVECLGYSEALESGQKRMHRELLSLKQNLLSPSQVLESRRYDFKFRLPAKLPHSIECEDLGYVRYCCRAIAYLDGADSVETVSYFSLIEEVDLNLPWIQQTYRPSEQASASTVVRIGGRSGKEEVKAALVLSKGAYVPGEDVKCMLSVHCASCDLSVEQASIRLVQSVAVQGHGENGRSAVTVGTCCNQTIVHVQVQADEQYSEHYWSAKCQLHILGAVASSVHNSESSQHPLTVNYVIEMNISLVFGPSPAKVVTVSCPVVIGTVPLLEATTKAHPSTIEPSFVEVFRCVVSETEHHAGKDKQPRSSSLIGLIHRRKTSYRMAPPVQYTLYCIYYPTISLRNQKGLRSILKRHSVDNSLDAVGSPSNQEQLQTMPRTTSLSWYETPL